MTELEVRMIRLSHQMIVADVGPGDEATPGEVLVAEKVGALLADRGAVVATGGPNGVMQGASRGCRQRGGLSIGFLPGTDRAGDNEDISIAVPTGLGELRNWILVRSSDAVISIGGSWGTLS
jgi:uncharacterized protein (TIGR00725 family)